VERVYSRDAHVGFGREAIEGLSAKDARRVGAFASCPEKEKQDADARAPTTRVEGRGARAYLHRTRR
jgi:hypothetical protein